jgi:hypothetical protein
VTDFIRCELRPNERVASLPLADRYHVPNPVHDLADGEARVFMREHGGSHPVELPRDAWRFPDAGHIEMKDGFTPGALYDVIYRSANPPIVGLGFLAIRDAGMAALGGERKRQSVRRRDRARLSLRRLAKRPFPAAHAVPRAR